MHTVPRYYITAASIAEVNRIGFARTAELRRKRETRCVTVNISNRDAAFLESLRLDDITLRGVVKVNKSLMTREEVCEAFGVPSAMLPAKTIGKALDDLYTRQLRQTFGVPK